MPIYQQFYTSKSSIYIWKIEESLEFFLAKTYLNEVSKKRLENMNAISHKRGFLAVRMLLQHINLTDNDLIYSESGKPFLSSGKHISISHAHTFSVIMISDEICGTDIEIKKEKIIKIGPRFCDESHLNDYQEDQALKISKYTIAWGIKEAIFKIKNEAGISFPKHISIDPFNLNEKQVTANLLFNKKKEVFQASFKEIEGFILVWIES